MALTQLLVEKRWNSHPRNVQHAREAVRDLVIHWCAPEVDFIELAVGEACANAVEHGAPAGPESHFTLRCLLREAPADLIFEVEDEGHEFCLSALTRTPDLEAEGGRGLFLINQIMDEVILASSPHGLTVRMVKHLGAA